MCLLGTDSGVFLTADSQHTYCAAVYKRQAAAHPIPPAIFLLRVNDNTDFTLNTGNII